MNNQGTQLRVCLSRDASKAFSVDTGLTKTAFLSLETTCLLGSLVDVHQRLSIEGCETADWSPVLQLLRKELPANSKQAAAVIKFLADKGVTGIRFPLESTMNNTPESVQSDFAKGCEALLALRAGSVSTEAATEHLHADSRDQLGFADIDYEDLMNTARGVCRQANVAEKRARQMHKESLLIYVSQIQTQLSNNAQMFEQGLISEACHQTLQDELNSKLAAHKEQLASTEQAIASLQNDALNDKEAMMFVLKLVAEGCGKRRRLR